MAHFLLHFSIGLAVGTCLWPWFHRRGTESGRLAQTLGKWLILCYGLGIFAALPGIFDRLGMPEAIRTGWWMNIFFFHPLIDRLKQGGMLIGEILIIACFAVQYLLLLITLRRLSRILHEESQTEGL